MRWICLAMLMLLLSCEDGDRVISPKPHMYPRIDFPIKEYINLDSNVCPFTFEYPKYAEFKLSTNFFDEQPSDPCWFDINIPSLNSQIHFSYYPISKVKSFDNLVYDAFSMVEKHNSKAFFREETKIEHSDVSGILFEIKGPVASPIQFYVSDSTNHFVRASLYFNDKVNADSLAPIIKFVKDDIDHMLSTLEWK